MYRALRSKSPSRNDSSEVEKFYETPDHHAPGSFLRMNISWFLFFSSLIVNLGFVVAITARKDLTKCLETSKFAGLTRTIPKAWTSNSGANETDQEFLWDETSYDRGQIALADDYAKEMGLPRAQRFPWDQSKGIYLINAYHNIHCVKTIRTSVVEFHNNTPQSSPYLHVIHCLNVLRDEVMCNADDTPRYTGFQEDQKSGLGQVRMCRDWKQLEVWADEHTACWKHVGEIREDGFRELDRYRFCPPGSPYEEMSKTAWLRPGQHVE
ncbi:uncharacterized protein Bfra_004943 [Botrytis fragariae]|uniref:Uncharacterized protein n=1 Tax=Botrytis fragariae TaxID=1964551 RepID=A0A8H6EIH5_9HELO|nr:uncharacterized protein Bfra_004943 [Botrytis fragariae]KAF5873482.1 hypothetical protein Bfra_004943 [Botrytis fragariae]